MLIKPFFSFFFFFFFGGGLGGWNSITYGEEPCCDDFPSQHGLHLCNF